MIRFPPALLREIVEAAEAAYPRECCGLLAGYAETALDLLVTRVVPSPNMAQTNTRDSFEVDPQVRFDLMRALEGGRERIIGHYHSHPDHPAQPSRRDLDWALEPELVWVITSVMGGQALHTTAHVLDGQTRQFRQIGLRTTDWSAYGTKEPNP